MIYAEVVAGGKGTRMGETELPKQFLMLGDKPIVIHTLKQFLMHPEIDRVILCVPEEWLTYAEGMVNEYFGGIEKIAIVAGGEHRNATVLKGCEYIEKNWGISEDDIILTQDAVRPFVTQRIISDNIEAVKKHGAAVTAVAATDTIAETDENGMLRSIPDRARMHQEQTPQTFMLKQMREVIESFSDEEQRVFTDVCKAYITRGIDVKVVDGQPHNIKITTPFDLKMAEVILRNNR